MFFILYVLSILSCLSLYEYVYIHLVVQPTQTHCILYNICNELCNIFILSSSLRCLIALLFLSVYTLQDHMCVKIYSPGLVRQFPFTSGIARYPMTTELLYSNRELQTLSGTDWLTQTVSIIQRFGKCVDGLSYKNAGNSTISSTNNETSRKVSLVI